ncbi:MAG: hypothetical protein ACOC9X_05245 [bacterium]
MARRRSGGRSASLTGALLNIVSLLIVLLILLVVAGVIAAIVAPDLAAPLTGLLGREAAEETVEPTPTRVALAAIPTLADTPQPEGGGLAPTWTPVRPDETPLPTATNTRRATLVPSITPTFPPPTNTPTNTPTPTPTETPGPSPTATNTRSAFLFTKTDSSPMYLQNFANNAGCNWMGIAGEVLDVNENPVPSGQYRVHVWGSGVDERVPVGGAPAYSPSGYEQFLFNAPVIRDYNVQLETSNGTAVSQVYSVQSRASCNQNLLLFDFVQNHS